MTSVDLLEIVDLLERGGVEVWVDGGWGVDALIGRQTRQHGDLDIAVRHADVPKLRELLAARGYRELTREDARDWNFVLGDEEGREVDVHSYASDSEGKHSYGIEYPAGALTGVGSVNGRAVKCVAAEHAVHFRTGHDLREVDIRDVRALHNRFGVPFPKEHEEWLKQKQGQGLLARIRGWRPNRRRTIIVAIDGYGGSGKSTLAKALASRLDRAAIVCTDDFARPNVPGWEWERMKTQVLDPLDRDQPGRYQRHDWKSDSLAEWHDVPVGRVVIVEGVSSMRTELGPY